MSTKFYKNSLEMIEKREFTELYLRQISRSHIYLGKYYKNYLINIVYKKF